MNGQYSSINSKVHMSTELSWLLLQPSGHALPNGCSSFPLLSTFQIQQVAWQL
jgi:hypothetical protein